MLINAPTKSLKTSVSFSNLCVGDYSQYGANLGVIPDQPITELLWISCIQYLIQFSQHSIKAVINFSSKLNAMQLGFARKLDFHICKTNIGMQMIDNSKFEIFGIIILFFWQILKTKSLNSLRRHLYQLTLAQMFLLECHFLP